MTIRNYPHMDIINKCPKFNAYCVSEEKTEEICVYEANVAHKLFNSSQMNYKMGFLYFDSDFERPVKLIVNSKIEISELRLRPESDKFTYIRNVNKIEITIYEPVKISLEVNGNIYNNLFIFANPIYEAPEISKNDLVFESGYHDVGLVELQEKQTVYLKGGSIVRGSFFANAKEHIKICGSGILLGDTISAGHKSMINFLDCNNITIEGVIIIDSPGWTIVTRNSCDILIDDVKIINYRQCTDGFDPNGCSHVEVRNVFFRISDDCISIKAYRTPFGNSDILIHDSIFWSDMAHGILIGCEGNSTYTRNITFRDNMILEVRCPFPEYYGTMAVVSSDNMTMENILFENIFVDDFTESSLIDLRIENNVWTYSNGKIIKNIKFSNIDYAGENNNPSFINGSDKKFIDTIYFDNITINGNNISSLEESNFAVGECTKNLCFVNSKKPININN